MKVALLSPLPPPSGGIAEWTQRMLVSDLKDDWKLEVVDEKVIEGREVFGEKSKKHFFTEIKRCFRIWRDLKEVLKDQDVKIVHSCIPSATLSMVREIFCALIAKCYSKKFVVHFRCTIPNTTRGSIGRFVLRLLCKLSDIIIVLNNASLKYLEDKIKTKIVMIPNFVLTDEISMNKTVSENINSAIYVGGVIEEKGCLDLIEAAKCLPSIVFKLVGTPSAKVAVAALNVENVMLCGPLSHNDVIVEMRNADVFVFLSYYDGEGFSNALVEAMACGLPCIVTDWAANVDMIEDKGGVSVKPRSPLEVVDAFNAIKDREVRQKQSDFNIAKVIRAYESKRVLDMYVDVYNELVGVDIEA